jgi:site-specific recombinase XerD
LKTSALGSTTKPTSIPTGWLQRIAKRLGIKTHIHHYIECETFATNFIRLGGKVEVLQKLMDHEDISTTMRYVHVDDDMKQAAIAMMEAMDTG